MPGSRLQGRPQLGAGRALFEQQGPPACKLSLYLVPINSHLICSPALESGQGPKAGARRGWTARVLPMWGHVGRQLL